MADTVQTPEGPSVCSGQAVVEAAFWHGWKTAKPQACVACPPAVKL